MFEPTIALNHGGKPVPRIGLGTDRINDPAQIETAIRDAGVRHFDTASFYGTEETLGQGISNCIDQGLVQRKDLFVTTKIWHTEYEDPEQALRGSLSKLRLDYVDLYLIHWPANGVAAYKVPMHVLWAKMENLKEIGLAKAIGVSNFNT